MSALSRFPRLSPLLLLLQGLCFLTPECWGAQSSVLHRSPLSTCSPYVIPSIPMPLNPTIPLMTPQIPISCPDLLLSTRLRCAMSAWTPLRYFNLSMSEILSSACTLHTYPSHPPKPLSPSPPLPRASHQHQPRSSGPHLGVNLKSSLDHTSYPIQHQSHWIHLQHIPHWTALITSTINTLVQSTSISHPQYYICILTCLLPPFLPTLIQSLKPQ